jgi:hypothetical protein
MATSANSTRYVIRGGVESRERLRVLYEFAADPHTAAGTSRIVQVWGRRPDRDE